MNRREHRPKEVAQPRTAATPPPAWERALSGRVAGDPTVRFRLIGADGNPHIHS
jgi:hypothetical protein